ncbi:hypothetical protein NXX56_29100 [Bacteroides thetaiotaomicron]|nr:hypothetical protein [Bacteroides thetaiotaomicron]
MIDDARSFGKTGAEKEYYEENAISLYPDSMGTKKATQLNDYAKRGLGVD